MTPMIIGIVAVIIIVIIIAFFVLSGGETWRHYGAKDRNFDNKPLNGWNGPTFDTADEALEYVKENANEEDNLAVLVPHGDGSGYYPAIFSMKKPFVESDYVGEDADRELYIKH